jgi:hypothetical protein
MVILFYFLVQIIFCFFYLALLGPILTGKILLYVPVSFLFSLFYVILWYIYVRFPWYLDRYSPIVAVIIVSTSVAAAMLVCEPGGRLKLKPLFVFSSVAILEIGFVNALVWGERAQEKQIWEQSATSFETLESNSCWTGEQQLLKIPKAFIADKNQRHATYFIQYGWVTIAVSYPDIMPWNLARANADRTDRVEIPIWKSQCRDKLCGAYLPSYKKIAEYSTTQFNVYCKEEECAATNLHAGAGCQYIRFDRKHLTEFPTMAAKVNALIESWHHN